MEHSNQASLAFQLHRLSPDLQNQICYMLDYQQLFGLDPKKGKIRPLFERLQAQQASGSLNPTRFWTRKSVLDLEISPEEFQARTDIVDPWQRYLYFACKRGRFYPGCEEYLPDINKAVSQAIKVGDLARMDYFLRHWQQPKPKQMLRLMEKAVTMGRHDLLERLLESRKRMTQSDWAQLACRAHQIQATDWVNHFTQLAQLSEEEKNRAALVGAMRAGRKQDVHQCLENITRTDKLPHQYAMMACKSGDIQVLKLALTYGKRLNKSMGPAQQILATAAGTGSREMVEFLIGQGFQVNFKVIQAAALKRQYELLSWLLRSYPNEAHLDRMIIGAIKKGSKRDVIRHLEAHPDLTRQYPDSSFYRDMFSAGMKGHDREAVERALTYDPTLPHNYNLLHQPAWVLPWLQETRNFTQRPMKRVEVLQVRGKRLVRETLEVPFPQ